MVSNFWNSYESSSPESRESWHAIPRNSHILRLAMLIIMAHNELTQALGRKNGVCLLRADPEESAREPPSSNCLCLGLSTTIPRFHAD